VVECPLEMKFDATIGNPPFNADRSAGKGSTSVIWDTFVEVAMEFTKQDGFVVLLHPSPWRKPDHKLFNVLRKKRMTDLRMISGTESKRLLGVGTKVDFYCFQNKNESVKTRVVDEDGAKIDLNIADLPFLPGKNVARIVSLIAVAGEERANLLYDTSYHGIRTSPEKTHAHPHAVIQTINRSGPQFRYSDHCEGHYGVRKVIVNEAGNLYPINDWQGKYAMSQGCFGIVVDTEEEAAQITEVVGGKSFYDILIESTRWSHYRTDYRMFKYFRKDFWKSFK
jgi:hypothetical protein